MVIDDVPHFARDRESDLDVVVEGGIVVRIAEFALKAGMDLIEFAKAAGDLGAVGANQQPVHLEQADLGGVNEQLDRLRVGQACRAGIVDRVHAKEIVIIRRAHEGFQPREHRRIPAPGRSERREAFREDVLDDWRGRAHHDRHPLDTDNAGDTAPQRPANPARA